MDITTEVGTAGLVLFTVKHVQVTKITRGVHHVTSPLSLTTKQARAMIKTITYTQLLCLNNGPTLQMTTGNFIPNYKTRVWTFVATTLSWGLLKSNTGNCR